MNTLRNLFLSFLMLALVGCSKDDSDTPGNLVQLYAAEGQSIDNVAVSSNQKFYVLLHRYDNTVNKFDYEILAIENGKTRSLVKSDGRVDGLLLSDDEEYLYYGIRRSDGGVYLQKVEVDNGFFQSLVKIEDAIRISGLRKLSNGSLMFSVTGATRTSSGRIMHYDFSSGISEIASRGQYLELTDVNETKGIILAQDSFDPIVVMDMSGNILKLYGQDTLQIGGIAISPDGNGILGRQIFDPESAGDPHYQGSIYYDLATDHKTLLSEKSEDLWPISYLNSEGSKILGISRTPGGVSEDDEIVFWDLLSGERKKITSNTWGERVLALIKGNPSQIFFIQYEPDGNVLYRVDLE